MPITMGNSLPSEYFFGYKDNMNNQVVNIEIQGMSCASCVSRIEKVLKKENGILEASVNLATEKAQITFDPSILKKDKIKAIIENAGYEAAFSTEKKNDSALSLVQVVPQPIKNRGYKKRGECFSSPLS